MRMIIFIIFFVTSVFSSYAQSVDILTGVAKVDTLKNWDCYLKKHYMQSEVLEAFKIMRKAAKKDGIILNIVSAYRSFDKQKEMWNNRIKIYNKNDTVTLKEVKRVMMYCAMPGMSRHHWGTDLDFSLKTKDKDAKYDPAIYKWLANNASKYGFYQPYSSGRNKGHAEEKWHWSYKSLADKYLNSFLEEVDLDSIRGFLGDKYIDELNIKDNWLKSISNFKE